MRHWQRTIEQGNRCFVTGALIDAREHYLHALALAQVLLEHWGDADEAVMAFVISHHNLADLHLQLEQPEETAEYLCACHERLLRVSADQKLPLALRQAAQHHSRRTYVELLSFIGEHGAYPRTERLLKGPPNAEVRPEFLAPPPLTSLSLTESFHAPRLAALALRLRCPGTAHRCADHGDPPQQAPPDLCEQPERRAGRHALCRAAGGKPAAATGWSAGEAAHPGCQQWRWACQPLAVLDRDVAPGRWPSRWRPGAGHR